MTRNDYKTQFTTLLNRMEEYFVGTVYMALRKQYLKVIKDIRAGGIDHARRGLNDKIMSVEMGAAVQKIYKQAGVYMAQRTLSELKKYKSNSRLLRSKKEAGTYQYPLSFKYATFGFNPEWVQSIIDFFHRYLLEKAVIAVSNTTRDKIMTVLDEATTQGWSNEQTVTALSDLIEIKGRARMIVRTETVRAANFGVLLGADKYDFETVKEWVAIQDNRTRHSHRTVDQQQRDVGEVFSNGLRFPGDPNGSAAEVINCRCTLIMVPKRDAQGNLIPKQSSQLIAA